MPLFVLDCSVAVSWLLPDEAGAPGTLLDRLVQEGAVVPGHWPLEVGNTLLVATRRKRLTHAQRRSALQRLGDLPIAIDGETAARSWVATMELADRHNLSLYDAAYLELALRRRTFLATLDARLAAAARAEGVDRPAALS